MKFRKPALWLTFFLILIVIFFVSHVWFFLGDNVREYFNRIPFDSAAWKDLAQVCSDNPVRLRMVDDLLRSHHLVGMSRAEIDDLLGPSTQTGHFGNYDYVYWLGPERSFFSVDSEWLVIKLQDGTVVDAKIARD
jgi:hypothetical protein